MDKLSCISNSSNNPTQKLWWLNTGEITDAIIQRPQWVNLPEWALRCMSIPAWCDLYQDSHGNFLLHKEGNFTLIKTYGILKLLLSKEVIEGSAFLHYSFVDDEHLHYIGTVHLPYKMITVNDTWDIIWIYTDNTGEITAMISDQKWYYNGKYTKNWPCITLINSLDEVKKVHGNRTNHALGTTTKRFQSWIKFEDIIEHDYEWEKYIQVGENPYDWLYVCVSNRTKIFDTLPDNPEGDERYEAYNVFYQKNEEGKMVKLILKHSSSEWDIDLMDKVFTSNKGYTIQIQLDGSMIWINLPTFTDSDWKRYIWYEKKLIPYDIFVENMYHREWLKYGRKIDIAGTEYIATKKDDEYWSIVYLLKKSSDGIYRYFPGHLPGICWKEDGTIHLLHWENLELWKYWIGLPPCYIFTGIIDLKWIGRPDQVDIDGIMYLDWNYLNSKELDMQLDGYTIWLIPRTSKFLLMHRDWDLWFLHGMYFANRKIEKQVGYNFFISDYKTWKQITITKDWFEYTIMCVELRDWDSPYDQLPWIKLLEVDSSEYCTQRKTLFLQRRQYISQEISQYNQKAKISDWKEWEIVLPNQLSSKELSGMKKWFFDLFHTDDRPNTIYPIDNVLDVTATDVTGQKLL